VSLYQNNSPWSKHVAADTKKRVLHAARQLGYRPDLVARTLRNRRSENIGVVVFDITDPYCSLILKGIEDRLYEDGYMPILTDLQNDPKKFDRCVGMLLGRRMEGLILIANPLYLESDIVELGRRMNVPLVIVGHEFASGPISSVTVDNSRGTQLAMEHLYELGHRKFAFIRGPKGMVDTEPRWRGITEFASKHGLSINSDLAVDIEGVNSSYEESYRLTERLLQSKRDFTALVAFDDLSAFAAIGALARAGLRVPQDCSVTGFDDIPGAGFYNPPLTTVRQDLERQGAMAAESIAAMVGRVPLQKKAKAVNRTIVPQLVVRGSTSSPAKP
jgi:LacI family transcriptional regulator